MIIDADSVGKDSELEADVCIIGTGAAGISMAVKFADTDLKIIMLESGEMEKNDDLQKLNDLETAGLPIEQTSRRRIFGGTTTAWSGRWKPHDPIDLVHRDWVPNSGWPISKDELYRYYEESAKLLGTPSVASSPEHKGFPFDKKIFAPEVIRIVDKKYLDFGQRYKSLLETSKNITIYTGATVTMLEHSGNSIKSAEAKTLSGNQFNVRAKAFVIAAGGIENARLLLLSNIGNEEDQVGRYYMDHQKGIAGEVVLSDPKTNFPWMTGIGFSEYAQKENRTLNSFVLLFPIYERGEKLKILPKGLRVFAYKILKLLVGEPEKISKVLVRNYMEQAPDPENRITLGESTDAFGNRLPRVKWSLSDLDKRTMIVLHKMLRNEFQKNGLGTFDSPLLIDTQKWPISEDASHHMGSTRMGTDPKTSVVDPNCLVHGTDNLYIAGSSAFPTGGASSPTTTIVALALRLADHLISSLQPGRMS